MSLETLRLMTGTGSRNFDEIDRLLSCPICLEVYSKPVVILPCQHNLCRKCANDVFQNRGTPMGSGGRFRCPTCRYEVVLDRHGVYGLQRNLLVENIIDIYQSEDRNHSFKKVETLMCEEHEEEKVNIYCVTCQKPTCSLCKVFGQHQTCEVSPMDKVYKDQKKEMSDAIAQMVSGNDRLQAIISHTEELGEITKVNGQQIKTDLCSAFDNLYTVLEERKTSLMAKITADVQERTQALQEMLTNYGQQLEDASKLMESSLALLEERNISQFLNLSRNMINKVLKAVESSEVRKPPFNIQHMDEFQTDFQFQREILSKLDFKEQTMSVRNEFAIAASSSKDQGHFGEESDVDKEDNYTTVVEASDSDDANSVSMTSRGENNALGMSRSSTDSSFSRDFASHSRENEKGGCLATKEDVGGSSSRNSNLSDDFFFSS